MPGKNFEDYSDEKLVELAQSGDSDAESALIVRFMGLVKLETRPFFLVGADKSDLIQEGSIGLVAAIRDYDESRGGSFRSFAEICISRKIYSAIKTAVRKKHQPLNDYVSLDRNVFENINDDSDTVLADNLVVPNLDNPEDLIIEKESYDELIAQMNERLTTLEKQVLELFLDGYSYAQIAESLSKTVKAVDNAIQRIKKKVKKLLREKSD